MSTRAKVIAIATLCTLALPALSLAAQFNVSITDTAFVPSVTTIQQGDMVVWTNNATSPRSLAADLGTFKSYTMQPGQTYSFIFTATTPRAYRYFEQALGKPEGGGMSGTVVVTSATASPTPSPGAAPTPPPSAAEPYQFKNEGIFGCNTISGANSAGAMSAIGGVYVPVNDAAVTLNSGIITYKECVLRPLQDRLRESAMSALFKKAYIGIETGREGNKQYVVNIGDELSIVDDKATLAYLTGAGLESVNPAFRDTIKRALAVNYRAEKNGNNKQRCTYSNLKPSITSPTRNDVILVNFEKLGSPSCNPLFEFIERKDERDMYRMIAMDDQRTIWNWGQGFYAKTDNAQDPYKEKTLTPSSVVRESFQQIFGSPVRQLESANDIGQMIGALFSSATTQAITDNKGLAGLAQGVAGQPSYLDQVARESSQGVIGAAVNAALAVLNPARQVEGSYFTSMNAVVTRLTSAIEQLRATERKCWELVVPRVQDYAAGHDPAIALDSAKILASTSSLAFAQQVIDSQITPLADAAITNVQSAQRALSLIDQLMASVTNTNSITTQRLALQQLDSLVAQGALHTAAGAQNAAKQRDDVAAAMAQLITDTAKAWGDSTDPEVGWCNINNETIIRTWAERWKK